MVKRLSFVTVLIALFGVAMSALAQNTVEHAGSSLASVEGDRCDYTQGIVCSIDRGSASPELRF